MDEQADGFITLPPGIAPANLPQVAPTPRVAPDEITFFPAAPGAVPVVEAPAPEVPVETAIEPPVETAVEPPAAVTPVWSLTVPGSAPRAIAARLYLGRNPAAPAGDDAAQTLALDDHTKSVSKTHAMLELDADTLLVHDLDSTNGVWITHGNDTTVEVLPGRPATIESPATLELGDFVLHLSRA